MTRALLTPGRRTGSKVAGARPLLALAIAILASHGALAEPPPETAVPPAASAPAAAPAGQQRPTSGLPIPRFVSLKSDRVNLRTGPGTQYPTSWVFRRAGLPLEVVAEFDNWRQVRDSEGTSGWVLQSLLSGRRTAVVTPWDAKEGKSSEGIPIRSNDSDNASPVATAEPGVVADLHTCDGRWCDVSVGDFRGFLPQKLLWGVYENEVLK